MFANLMQALLRWSNQTMTPILVGVGITLLEFSMGALSWVLVIMGNGVITILGFIIEFVPAPPVTLDDGTFGREFIEIATLAGVWEALGFYVGGLAVAFIARLISLGFVGR